MGIAHVSAMSHERSGHRPPQQTGREAPKELNMKTTYVWGPCLSATAMVAIAATVVAQQPVPAVPSTPQPVTAFEPAAPAALDRDSDDLQPQPDAATQTEIGDRATDGGWISYPPLSDQPQPAQRSMNASGPFGTPSMAITGRPGELGVWLASSGGAGVEVRRISPGGPAEQAGLQAGDVILQINGRGATSPLGVAQLIRSIPAGQPVTIEIWRDGQQQELQAMLRPQREQYEAAYRGDSMTIGSSSSDLAARTMRLEEQLTMVMQELRALRQEMAQLRLNAGSAASTTRPSTPAPADTEPGFNDLERPAAIETTPPAATTAPAATTPPAATTEPADDAADPFADEAAAPPATPPATEPAAEDEDVFGDETTGETPAAEPAESTEAPATEAPPAESTESTAESDDLFE
jgi:hypothetical protein